MSNARVRIGSARFLGLPRTRLGWAAFAFATAHFLFMALFWLQARIPGRDRSTFFSDPINAACLIAACASPIVGAALAVAAMRLNHERPFILVVIVMMGLLALLWSLGVMLG
jgi:cytochrome bd-type quinol oxidase subunit 2